MLVLQLLEMFVLYWEYFRTALMEVFNAAH